MNTIDVQYLDDSPNTLYYSTLFLSFISFGFLLFGMKQKFDDLEKRKKNIGTEDILEDNVYQCWSGIYADGDDSLSITLVRKKISTKKNNEKWIDWDGSPDASVISRDYYLGNQSPSFVWTVRERENDVEFEATESMIDGWNSVIQVKLIAFISSEMSSMNDFIKNLMNQNRIEWDKTLMSHEEYESIFR